MTLQSYTPLRGLGLSDQSVARLRPRVQSQHLEAGAILWHKGVQQQPLTYIMSGLVSAGIPGPGNTMTPLNIYGPGTWFGEAAFLNRRASIVQYTCLTPVSVQSISCADALHAFEQEPAFACFIARLISWRDQQHTEMLALMKISSPELRVVMGLALFAEALRNSSSHMASLSSHETLELPLKQDVLASLCGVSRGAISLCLQQLSAAGWAHLDYGAVMLKGLSTWREFSRTHRESGHSLVKISMSDILQLMQEALPRRVPKICIPYVQTACFQAGLTV